MTKIFLDTTFTRSVKQAQTDHGSRANYARLERSPDFGPDALMEPEIEFIQTRDSFYMASASSSGWPYVQHRGGPVGFVKVLNETTFGFADFRGNRQYISLGNLADDTRVCLFFMDYARQARLKILARAEVISAESHPEEMEHLEVPDYKARVERGVLFHLHAYDWNCPQHITARYSLNEIEPVINGLKQQIADLQAQLKQ